MKHKLGTTLLVLSCTAMLAGCGSTEQTDNSTGLTEETALNAIYEANQNDALLEHYDSFGAVFAFYTADGETNSMYQYMDADLFVSEAGSDIMIEENDTLRGFSDETKRPFIYIIPSTIRESGVFMLTPDDGTEEISSIETVDGQIVVTSHASDRAILESVLQEYGYDSNDVEQIEIVYTLDAETLAIVHSSASAKMVSGESHVMQEVTGRPNDEKYVADPTLMEQLNSTDTRHLKLVYGLDTPDEQIIEADVPKGVLAFYAVADGYEETPYKDSSYTVPYVFDESLTLDQTLYFKPLA